MLYFIIISRLQKEKDFLHIHSIAFKVKKKKEWKLTYLFNFKAN